jgi:hypothetical protein
MWERSEFCTSLRNNSLFTNFSFLSSEVKATNNYVCYDEDENKYIRAKYEVLIEMILYDIRREYFDVNEKMTI